MPNPVQLLVLPTAVLTVGKHGPFPTPQVGFGYNCYLFNIAQGAGWPTSGPVLDVVIERSTDAGVTWAADAAISYGPAPWGGNKGLITSDSYIVSTDLIAGPMAVTDLYRVTLTAHQTCAPRMTFSGDNRQFASVQAQIA